jgi:DNA-binding transcriptional regulator of glucitol operon
MAIEIQLKPEIEAELKAQAQQNGLPLSQYVVRILEEHVPRQPLESGMTPEERAQAFQDWAKSFPRRRSTPLLDHAISRDAFH